LPVGAEVVPGGGVQFRVWAPARRRVEVVFAAPGGRPAGLELELEREPGGGYFSGFAATAAAGDLYRFRLDGGDAFPDPASRFQPDGPHGPSRVVDPAAYRWRDAGWRGAVRQGQVIYEMHVGTLTREGTWAAAARGLLGPAALVLRWFAPPPGERGESGGAGVSATGDRLLLINLGADLEFEPAPEPLLAPPAGERWQVLWSSEDPPYGGSGAPPPEDAAGGWRLPGQAAIALAPAPREPCRESDESDERDERGDAKDGKVTGGRP
jgi:hypothetical protein